MLESLKKFLALLSGWIAAVGLFVFWVFASRRHKIAASVHVNPKEVPDAMSDVEIELRKRGLIK